MAYWPSKEAPSLLLLCTVLPGGRSGLGWARSLSYGNFDFSLNSSLTLALPGFSRL